MEHLPGSVKEWASIIEAQIEGDLLIPLIFHFENCVRVNYGQTDRQGWPAETGWLMATFLAGNGAAKGVGY